MQFGGMLDEEAYYVCGLLSTPPRMGGENSTVGFMLQLLVRKL